MQVQDMYCHAILKELMLVFTSFFFNVIIGWTPLHEASNRGWVSITKQLLKAGANVNVQGLENDTPLHDASGNGHTEVGSRQKQ
jgi:hypothetical protein